MRRNLRVRQSVPVLAGLAGALACSGEPTGPDVDALLPALMQGVDRDGFTAVSLDTLLVQPLGRIVGPGGIEMLATAHEYIHEVELDEQVLRVSGVTVHAVPAYPTEVGAFDYLSFGASLTGSTEPIRTGTYALSPELPAFDYVTVIPLNVGMVQAKGTATLYFVDGEVTITSIDYSGAVLPCGQEQTRSFEMLHCEQRIGEIRGTVEFRVTMPGGTSVVQPGTSFTLPIRRRVLTGRVLHWSP